MAAIDPHGPQGGCLGRDVVVEEALRHVEDLPLGYAESVRLHFEVRGADKFISMKSVARLFLPLSSSSE